MLFHQVGVTVANKLLKLNPRDWSTSSNSQ